MDYKIEIPKPCHEDWEAMTPQTQGRFCGSCQKTVVDFTQMQPHEVQAYFAQNQSQHLCGRFNHDQLDGLRVEVPSHLLHRTYSFQRMFVLAFFISMGAGLVSCTNNSGKTKDVQKVEVVEKPVELSLQGDIIIDSVEAKKLPPPPLPPRVHSASDLKDTKTATFTTKGAIHTDPKTDTKKILTPPKVEWIGKVAPQPKKVITTVTTTTNSTMGMPSLSPPTSPKADDVVKPDTLMLHTKDDVSIKTTPEIKPVADTLVLKGDKTVKKQISTGGIRLVPKTENK